MPEAHVVPYNHLMERGARFGAYHLVEELGAGGMGVVWRAHDARLGRDVALKILPPHLAKDGESLVRFEREARGLAALSHPNIVSIFDLGESDGVRYIVTELLRGETLRHRLRGGALPWQKAAEIAAAVADGLSAAHAKGIVHRDLKPENIFLTDDGRVKILDFGIARELAMPDSDAITAVHRTEPGYILGTLGYMAPEQLRGGDADVVSDIFSLGAVLYEMLAGKHAFLRPSSADTIAAILTADPEPLEPSTGIPPDLFRVLSRCLEKQPRARFQSASDLAFALRDITLVRYTGPGSARRKVKWLPVAAVMAAVLAAAIFLIPSLPTGRPSGALAPRPERMSLAVLPFEADAEESYAGEGLADSLFRRLAKSESVDVIARKANPGDDLSLATIGARNLLRGSLMRRGDEVVVAAEIVEVPSGRRLWSEKYTAPANDLLSLDRSLSADVERFLARNGGGSLPPAPSSTVDAEAYREYLKGRYYWNKFTVDGFHRALDHYQLAIDRDPTFALAYAGMADTYSMLGLYEGNRLEVMPKARAAAERAVALDGQLGEAWSSLGSVLYLHDWKWRQAEVALRRGVELNPRFPTSHHSLAYYLGLVGRFDEALSEIRKAEELDPLAVVLYIDRAWLEATSGRRDLGLQTIEKAVRHDPRSPLAQYERSWHLEYLRRYDEAISALETALKLDGKDPAPAARLRKALMQGGEQGYFRERLNMVSDEESPHVNRGMILARLGDHQAALDEMEKGLADRERDLIYINVSEACAPLRQYTRFQKVLEAVGFDSRS